MKDKLTLQYCINYKFKFKDKISLILFFKPDLTERRYYTKKFISFLISKVEKIELKGEYSYDDIFFIKNFKKELNYK